MRRPHPAPAPAGDGFDHDRIANPLRDLDRLGLILDDPIAPRRYWHTGLTRRGPGGILVAHRPHRGRRWPDEFDFTALADLGEVRVFRQEAVAGMNRIDVAHFGRAHDAIDLQVTVGARGGTDADRFVRQLHMERIDVGLRVDSQRADIEFLAGANDAKRDFSAVGDEDFFEHVSGASFQPARTKTQAGSLRYPGLTNLEKGLAKLNGLAVLRHDLGDYPADLGLDFVHHLHGLDDADDGIFIHLLPDIDERRRFR